MACPGTGSCGTSITDAQRIEIVALAKAGISRNKICVQVFGSKGRNFDKVKVDCYDREIVGWEFAVRGRAKEAARALEMACLTRFGTLRPSGDVPVIRSDNGLIFPSQRLGDACRFAPVVAGVHYTVYAGTAWAYRAVVSLGYPLGEGGVCMAAPVSEFC
jgi:hypothetical protein